MHYGTAGTNDDRWIDDRPVVNLFLAGDWKW